MNNAYEIQNTVVNNVRKTSKISHLCKIITIFRQENTKECDAC